MGSNSLKLVFDKGPRKGAIFEFFPKKCIRIGRIVRGNNVTVKDDGVSQNHLRIEFNGENWTISDLDSSNGTLLNDEKIPPLQQVILDDGYVVKIGEETEFVVKVEKLVEKELAATVEDSLSRVSPRRTRAKKDVVSEIDVSKVPSEKNESVDEEVGLPESHRSQLLRPRGGTYSSQVDCPLPRQTYEDPKLLASQNLVVNDSDDNEQHGLSEYQMKADLPPLPAAKRPGRKKKAEANTGVQEAPTNSLCVSSCEDNNVFSNQSRRIMPSRAAAKRGMTQKNQDAAAEAFEDPKEFADVSLRSSVQQNNEPITLPGGQARRRGRPRGAANSSSIKKDHSQVADIDVENSKEIGASEFQINSDLQSLNSIDEPLCVEVNSTRNQPRRKAPRRATTRKDVTEKQHDGKSEVFGDLKEVAGANLVSSGQLKDGFTALPEEMPQLHVPQRVATNSSPVKKDPSSVSGTAGLDAFGNVIELNDEDNIVDHKKAEPGHRKNTGTEMNASTDNSVNSILKEVPLDVQRQSVPENSKAPVMDGPKTRNANRRVKKTGKRTRKAAKDSDIEQEEELDLSERNVEHDKVSDINQSKVEGAALKRSIRDMKDLENITLEEWFDRMEKHLPAKIDATADEIIAKLRQRQKQFEEFVLAHYNK